MSDENIRPVEDYEDINEEENLEERIRRLQNQLNDVVAKNNQLYQQNIRTEQALQISQARGQQLEANIQAIRSQRDLFIEREADALVNMELLEKQKENIEAKAQADLKAKEEENEPLRSKLNQTQAYLEEVRTKFGYVKHEQKEAELNLKNANQNILRLDEKCSSLESALEWYAEITSGIKYSVTFRFQKAMGRKLTSNDILIAYKETLQRHNPRRLSLRKNNVAEFITWAVKSVEKK